MRTKMLALGALQLFWLVGSACSGGDSGDVDASIADAGVRPLEVDLLAGNDTYPGGLGLLLAQITASDGLSVDLSVTSTPAITGEVVPPHVVGGGVVELLMRPTAAQVNQVVSVELAATAGADQATDTVDLNVIEYSDTGQQAQGDTLLAVFLDYLQANRPDLGLGPDTAWVESWNSEPVLIVTHRSYLSDTWQLHLAWHNTIAPDDWSFVTLRRRNQLEPELAFCFASQSTDQTVQPADLSDPRMPCAGAP